MKKLVVVLASLVAMFAVAACGVAADQPQTAPTKASDQAKAAAVAQNKAGAWKQLDVSVKAEGGAAASAAVSAPAKKENGKQPDTKKTDAGTPAAAGTISAQNKVKAKQDAEPQYRDEDIIGTRLGPDGKVEKVIRPGAKPIQAGNTAKQPDIAKKAPETPAAGAQQAKPSAQVTAGSQTGQDKPGAKADVKKDAAGKKPEDKSLAKKTDGTASAAVAGKPAPSKLSIAGKKRGKKAAHRKRHRRHYARRSHRRHHVARRHGRHRYAHKYAKKHKGAKAHQTKHEVKNAAAKPAAGAQDAAKLKKGDKPAGTKPENKAAEAPKSTH